MSDGDSIEFEQLLSTALNDEIPDSLNEDLTSLVRSLGSPVQTAAWLPEPTRHHATSDAARCEWGPDLALTVSFERHNTETRLLASATGARSSRATITLEVFQAEPELLESSARGAAVSVQTGKVFRFVVSVETDRFATDWVA